MSQPDEMSVAETAYVSPPVQRAVRLLRHIAEGDPVTNMAATARALAINRTTLLRLLCTLEAERFIEPRTDGAGWRIGIGLIGLSAQAFFSQDVVQVSVPVLSQLAETLQLSAHLGALDGLEVVYLVRRVPNHVFASHIRIGSRLPAHAANMGRIILAHLEPRRVERMFAGGLLRSVTAHTATTLTKLQAQLETDRALGLAWSDGNFEAGISSVAAAIFDATNMPVAAVNVSGQSAAFAGQGRREKIGTAVAHAATEISQRLGWVGPDFASQAHPVSGFGPPHARAQAAG